MCLDTDQFQGKQTDFTAFRYGITFHSLDPNDLHLYISYLVYLSSVHNHDRCGHRDHLQSNFIDALMSHLNDSIAGYSLGDVVSFAGKVAIETALPCIVKQLECFSYIM